MTLISKIVTLINIPANLLGKLMFPAGVLPGWLSITLISAAAGVLLLIIFKYTSRQEAIGRDYYVASLENGARCWAFVDARNQWFLHGYFG